MVHPAGFSVDPSTFRMLAENALDAVILADLAGNTVYANRAAYHLFGADYEKQDLIGAPPTRFWWEEDLPFLQSTVMAMAVAGGWNGEVKNRGPNDSVVYVHASAFAVRDEQGQPTSLAVFLRDISERKQSEEALRASEEKYRTLYETNADGVASVSMTGFIEEANPAFCEMTGYSVPELRKLTYPELTAEKWHKMEERILAEQVMTRGYSDVYEKEYIRKDGTGLLVALRTWLLRDKAGNPSGFWATVRNITERKKSEVAARQATERLNLIVSNLPVILFALDRNGIFTLSEGKGLAAMGNAPGRVVGMSVFDVYRNAPDVVAGAKRALAGEAHTQEVAVGPFILETSYAPLRDESGELNGVLGVSYDITSRKRAEQETRRLVKIIETSTDLVSATDMQGKVVYVNPAGLEMVGRAGQDFHTLTIADFHAPEMARKIQEEYLPVVMQKGTYRWEAELLHTDGHTIPVSQIATLIRDKDGNPEALSTTMRDITASKLAAEEARRLQEQIIEAQRHALQELSTPIIPVLERIIVMPLIGSIDTLRAKDITRALLAGISQYRAKIVIVDITGVPLVDSGVADHLNKTIQAARLKGAQTIVTGMSDAVAEAIIDLGIDWSSIQTLSDLQTGLMSAIHTLGLKLGRQS